MITVARSDLSRVAVAIDPAVTSGEEADDTGIVVVAKGPCQPQTCRLEGARCPGHAYVLDDRTCHVAPHAWASAAIRAFDDWQASYIVGEVNNGGDMIGTLIHAIRSDVPYKSVRATRGKRVRAEPVATLYEQGRAHHIGVFSELETQQTTWTPEDDSPDRVDALVWAIVSLGLVAAQGAAFLTVWRGQRSSTPRTRRGHNRPKLQVLEGGLCAHRWRAGRCVFCGETNRTE